MLHINVSDEYSAQSRRTQFGYTVQKNPQTYTDAVPSMMLSDFPYEHGKVQLVLLKNSR
jgi:hypothetical protein